MSLSFRVPVLALAAASLLAVVPSTSGAAAPVKKKKQAPSGEVCANKLCTRYRPATPSCYRFKAVERTARCFVVRAATHFDQPESLALSIAHRESRLQPWARNASSGAAGLFQFMPRTWASTPYGRRSPMNPRWAALAAMWMWHNGGYSHWSL